MAGALQGITVIELTTMITGPLCGQMLGDLGANVIKLENPKGGDPFRNFRGGLYSPHYCAYNRNKRSITVDLRSEAGKKIALELIDRADVVLENFRPGVMDRLGLGLKTLRARNPRLIYASITGFGKDGPYKDRPAYDAVAQAIAGTSSLFVDPERPQLTGPTISDNLTGIFACHGIMGALFERERTGVARTIEVNMLESTVALSPDPFANLTQLSIPQHPLSRVSASQSYALLCADGKLLAIHLSSQEKFWEGVTTAFDRMDLRQDPRFATRMSRIEHYVALGDEFRKTAPRRPRLEWMQRLEANDVPFAPINTLPEVMEDPQVRHLGTFFDYTHPTEGSIRAIRRPVWIDGSRDDQPLIPPPTLGENTDQILAELGYSADRIKTLRDGEIV
ncbi:MAG: CoA transferase [Alphaproteobacteria bacterium]|nr:CoA transferase [Alphaproteobacteria bacterium]